ncbi:hypothetical protein XA68_14975 [Ophiocordyceps unilateralis]|uniref:Uncharacterized protein n=1 Tax=Ophiocordyceps unilateralis TaxID=268505 RepID=A0A2A9PMU6_OPHUN|nr:hypothetical protein XA68_14975 [Ophiocordyceps unilateralis]
MSLLQARAGHVVLRGTGTFTGPAEATTDHGQLPQFLPRTQWPDDALAEVLGKRSASLGSAIDFQDAAQVGDLVDRARPIYSQLVPMPPYQNIAYELHDNVPWLAHAAILHDLLYRTMASRKPLSKDEMFALLRVVSYGMFQSMAWLYPWHIDVDSTGRPAHEWREEFNMRMRTGNFRLPSMDHEFHTRRLFGRRWVVAPIRCGEVQWNMTIFDRCRRILYIFDCGEAATRPERVEACVHLWVRFWNWLQLPYDFQYLVPAVTGHPGAKDSGLIAVAWLMSALRNQVGDVMTVVDDNNPIRVDIVFTSGEADAELDGGSLHLRDWLPDGCRAPSGGLLAVRRIVKVMICNELGLAYNKVLTKKFRNHRGRLPQVLPSALMLLRHTAKKMGQRDGLLRPRRFWTAQGGPQFALAQRMVAGDYDEHAPRRHKQQPLEEGYRVETREAALTRRDRQIIHWPAGVPYTAEFPLHRPAHGVELETAGLQAREDLDDRETRHFEVTLSNRAAATGFRRMPAMQRVVLSNMSARIDGRGDRMLKLTLGVHFTDQPVGHEVVVEMPIPEPTLETAERDEEMSREAITMKPASLEGWRFPTRSPQVMTFERFATPEPVRSAAQRDTRFVTPERAMQPEIDMANPEPGASLRGTSADSDATLSSEAETVILPNYGQEGE